MSYYTRDHLGSVREMCSSTGTITSRMAYDPYGVTTLVSGANMATFQGSKFYVHQPSGLCLATEGTGRLYDTGIGRWLSRDPLGNGLWINRNMEPYSHGETRVGANLYAYVANDPIDYLDPMGLDRMAASSLSFPGHESLYVQNGQGGWSEIDYSALDPCNIPNKGVSPQYLHKSNARNCLGRLLGIENGKRLTHSLLDRT